MQKSIRFEMESLPGGEETLSIDSVNCQVVTIRKCSKATAVVSLTAGNICNVDII